ncbi:MAG: hypothetical protein V2J55_03125 [Candidatus Competibacteraceae bacterium]|nr:hypothetical protein [Candidatus Competibacteraceae bacterium]
MHPTIAHKFLYNTGSVGSAPFNHRVRDFEKPVYRKPADTLRTKSAWQHFFRSQSSR